MGKILEYCDHSWNMYLHYYKSSFQWIILRLEHPIATQQTINEVRILSLYWKQKSLNQFIRNK